MIAGTIMFIIGVTAKVLLFGVLHFGRSRALGSELSKKRRELEAKKEHAAVLITRKASDEKVHEA